MVEPLSVSAWPEMPFIILKSSNLHLTQECTNIIYLKRDTVTTLSAVQCGFKSATFRTVFLCVLPYSTTLWSL